MLFFTSIQQLSQRIRRFEDIDSVESSKAPLGSNLVRHKHNRSALFERKTLRKANLIDNRSKGKLDEPDVVDDR